MPAVRRVLAALQLVAQYTHALTMQFNSALPQLRSCKHANCRAMTLLQRLEPLSVRVGNLQSPKSIDCAVS